MRVNLRKFNIKILLNVIVIVLENLSLILH